jgi:amidohydrolase
MKEGTTRMNLKQRVAAKRDLIVKLRRDLHRIPETAYTEKKTSAYVAEHLEALGMPLKTGIAKFGILSTLDSGRSGPCLLIRADMDALPVTEETGLPFASQHPGSMHACGHDAHMAMLLGAVAILKELQEDLRGTIKFVFQPAEEGPGGAKPMIEAGVMENPTVDYALGCHVWPDVPEGSIGVKSGPLMAAMDRFDLKIIGSGGHGAMPHQCVDALEIGCQVVGALQRITSRQMNPLTPTVVTVGSFHAGSTFNVIAPEAEMCGTTRTFEREIWRSWPRRLEKIIGGVCHAMGADYKLAFSPGYPPTINDAGMAEVVRRCAAAVVGSDRVVEPQPTMGGEDMAFFLERAKGCFFCLGVGREGGASIHNPRFDFNEDILLSGVETFCRVALELLARR